ncbi:hypothetical protein KPH14_002830 [Odynerus spinipes]|uniref:Uncharacterized protein n=1 Tax=Odynerus spinipes TaxID=1348599 RepID=A0AAD9RG31_9HYME|nr:hypothetical protein KPH14_002830 [Odynerus spinipes]
MGEELHRRIIDMLEEYVILVEDDELILSHEEDAENLYRSVEEELSDAENYEPPQKEMRTVEYIPLETKMKIVTLTKQHPRWSLKTLQRTACRALKRKEDVKRWERDIMKGGTTKDKYTSIDLWTFDRFMEARAEGLKRRREYLHVKSGVGNDEKFARMGFKCFCAI